MKVYKMAFCYLGEKNKVNSFPKGKKFNKKDFNNLFKENDDVMFIACYDKKGNKISIQSGTIL